MHRCYVGKRRLDLAEAEFSDRAEFKNQWHAYLLDENFQAEGKWLELDVGAQMARAPLATCAEVSQNQAASLRLLHPPLALDQALHTHC